MKVEHKLVFVDRGTHHADRRGHPEPARRRKLDDMRVDFEEVIRYNTEQLRRFWLPPFKRKQYRDEISHAQCMLRYIGQQREHLERTRTLPRPSGSQAGRHS